MLRRKFTALGLCLLLGLSLFPYAAMGADTPHFSLSANNEAPAVGQDIRVTVQGEQLTDLYGYELRMSYDAEHLRFKSASSHWTGLTVPAMDKDGEIVFAHTKLGKTAGENGKAAIATLSFESIAAGETAVVLTRVKLVDSQVEAVTLTPDVELKLDIASAENAVTYSDLDGHWAKAAVERAAALGIVKGYEDGTFRPNGKVTRAEFAAMLVRAVQLPASGDGVTLNFSDLDRIPEWARPFVSEAAGSGIIVGYADHTFRSANSITRAEMAVMIARAAGLNMEAEGKSKFADAGTIPSWAHPAIAAAAEAGLVNGKGNNRFDPAGTATRAEAVTLIMALLDYRAD